MPTIGGKPDQAFGHFRRHGLATLIVEYVALGAAEGFSKGGLGKPKMFADGFNAVHSRNNSIPIYENQQWYEIT